MAPPPKPAAKTPPGHTTQSITLAAASTTAGAMERLFISENISPAYTTTYDETQNLVAMRLMRQAIENRLKSPGQYNAPGATTETDIIDAPGQFGGFGSYPTLDPGVQIRLQQTLAYANNTSFALNKAFAQFVTDAITAATESITPPVAKYPDVTSWRTAGSGAPGSRAQFLETIGNNSFYSTKPAPPPARHKKPVKNNQPAPRIARNSTESTR